MQTLVNVEQIDPSIAAWIAALEADFEYVELQELFSGEFGIVFQDVYSVITGNFQHLDDVLSQCLLANERSDIDHVINTLAEIGAIETVGDFVALAPSKNLS